MRKGGLERWGVDRDWDPGAFSESEFALLENLKEYGHGDLESIGYRFTDAQRAVLKDLSNLVNSMKDRDIEEERPTRLCIAF